jgi:hypothetical protein
MYQGERLRVDMLKPVFRAHVLCQAQIGPFASAANCLDLKTSSLFLRRTSRQPFARRSTGCIQARFTSAKAARREVGSQHGVGDRLAWGSIPWCRCHPQCRVASGSASAFPATPNNLKNPFARETYQYKIKMIVA